MRRTVLLAAVALAAGMAAGSAKAQFAAQGASAAAGAQGQPATASAAGAEGGFAGWEIPAAPSTGRAPLRTELVSYTSRQDAESGDRAKAEYFSEIGLAPDGRGGYSGQIDLPFPWRGRQVFLRVEGFPQFVVKMNDRDVGMSQDSRVFSEFVVSPLVEEGPNIITLTPVGGGYGAQMETIPGSAATAVRASIMAQPDNGIEDYAIRATAGKSNGVFALDVALHNATAGEESFSVGYDITSPEGKLIYYDLRDVTMKANSRDTVRFSTVIMGAAASVWSAETPKLYRGTIYIKQHDRNIEYVPYTVGFGNTTFDAHGIVRNGKAIVPKTAQFNSDPTATATEARIAALRKSGVNMLCVDYPQPYWFYDICDRVGMYVVDQANINAGVRANDRTIGGAVANDPRAVDFFVQRVEAEYKRAGGHPCIVAWSLGGQSGKGYNMYMAYLAFKALDDSRPVLYRGADGEWNNDLDFAFPQ